MPIKILIIITLVFIVFFSFYLFLEKDTVLAQVKDCEEHNLSGYAWSNNIGWISFSCENQSPGVDYGVDVDSNGLLSGYAWSNNIGWINFDKNKLTGCPSGACEARLNRTNGEVSGWARAYRAINPQGETLGGWDGWIKLRSSSYGVSAAGCEWSGYAWAGDDIDEESNIGWIKFKGSNYGVIGNDNACSEINQAPVAEASIVVSGRKCKLDGTGGSRCSFNNPLEVNKGDSVTISSFDADINVNEDLRASYDPNGWNDSDFGVSSGGKCEWDFDFDGSYNSPPILDPADSSACSIGPKTVTFNTAGVNQEFPILKITDKGGLSSNESIVRITVNESCLDECSPDGSTWCVSPNNPNNNNYKDCGHFDDALPGGDICLELNPNSIPCGANETCVQNGNARECKLFPIITFSANPPEIESGGESTLFWDIKNIDFSNGDTCDKSNSDVSAEWIGPLNSLSGNSKVHPTETISYTLNCSNALGAVSETVNVIIQRAPNPIESLKILKDLLALVFSIF